MLTIERLPKKQRQQLLTRAIGENPFLTDEELMAKFGVSIQTIRLDRLELGIPEVRERIKSMAEQTFDPVRAIELDEVIGEIIDLQLDKSGISILEIKDEHVFSRTKIARGHHLFAQANSLAVAVIDEEVALTLTADIKFVHTVKLHEKCVAKAYVRTLSHKGAKAHVEVFTYVGENLVFEGNFTVFRSVKEAQLRGGNHADSH